ncbi:MAG: hypothetical protein Q4G39_06950 [Brachymonas sp.]|nr:hypothetical protein [Brachymonas sp.]
MTEYLLGILYHEPKTWALYQKGIVEDCESSTGVFIAASSPESAIEWGEKIAEALLRKVNSDETLDWKGLGYYCWLEESPSTSHWKHCLPFFQHVKTGEWPNFEAMGNLAYTEWAKNNGIKYA